MITLKILTFGLLWLTVQAQAAAPCQPYIFGIQNEADSRRPPQVDSFLLEVTSENRALAPSYLFGSFHSADPLVLRQWSALPILLAARPVRVFISERDLSVAADGELQLLPDDDAGTLSDVLVQHSGLYDNIVAILRQQRLPDTVAGRLKPWFAAALLNQIAAMPADNKAKIFDEYLLNAAVQLGIESRFLETFNDIADYYEQNFSQAEQIRLLWEAVCNQALLTQLTQQQTAAYAANRVGEFYRLLHRYSGTDATLSDKLTDVFVTRRNAEFWQQIRPQLQQGGAFVAVGSLHILGEGGLLQRLRDDEPGLSVRSIDLQSLTFALPPATLADAAGWLLTRARAEGLIVDEAALLDDLQIQHSSLPRLRDRLCPAQKNCIVESTYSPEQQTIFLSDVIFAQILAATPAHPQHYAGSLLIRELSRHLLYLSKAPNWRRQLHNHPRAGHCLRNIILYQASLTQADYLRERQLQRSAHPFPLDPRCPALPTD